MTSESTKEEEVWNGWLDGDTVNRLANFHDLTAKRVKAILSDPIPETMRIDPRHVYGCRAFWIATNDIPAMVFMPRRVNGDVFVKATRAIRRLHRETVGPMDLAVIEGVEVDAAIRMVENQGAKAYRFDVEGNVYTGLPEPVETAEDTPSSSP